jgi:hypothetical protein
MPIGHSRLHTVSAALSVSLWIAICATAPEFIWQGFWATVRHFSRADLLAALLIGLVLAFFVEPLLDNIRRLVGHHGATEDREPRSPVFTVCLSMAFALVSVCLHDALTAFVSGRAPDTGIDIAVTLTIGWAVVPLFVTAAWLSRGQRALTIPASVLAVLSPFLTAWLFSWSLASAISTAIPTAFIVLLGYSRSSGRRGFAPSAFRLATIAALWLALAAATDEATHLYTGEELWIDLRFYAGWVLGLLLAPYPYYELKGHAAKSAAGSGAPISR